MQEKAKIRVHPEALKSLVNQSWEFMMISYWERQSLSEEEEDFIKSCISEYYYTIPPEEFSEKSDLYLRNFRWQILRVKEKALAKSDFKIFAPFIWVVWKKKFLSEITLQNA
jgi:hypothetical protein